MPAVQRRVAIDETEASPSARRILDEAERLFAEFGYNGVSIRMIAGAAHANISSVYYHFGSKKDLLEAVCRRHMEPLIRERAALMDACRAVPADAPDAVERLVAAFVGPAIRKALGAGAEAETFRKFAGYLPTDPSPEVRAVMAGLYDESVRAFVGALRRLHPELDAKAFAWGMICTLGALFYAQTDTARIRAILGVSIRGKDSEEVVRMVTRYIVGGLGNLAPGAGR